MSMPPGVCRARVVAVVIIVMFFARPASAQQAESATGIWSRLVGTTPVGAAPDTSADKGFWGKTTDGLSAIWSGDGNDVYIPAYIWHAPWKYSSERRARYNEMPWGVGYGRSTLDGRQRLRSLYGMVSADSNSNPQYMLGYSWRWRGQLGKSAMRVGAGYTVLLFGRSEVYYAPLPAALPLVSVGTNRVELIATYVPGFHVGFFYGRVNLR